MGYATRWSEHACACWIEYSPMCGASQRKRVRWERTALLAAEVTERTKMVTKSNRAKIEPTSPSMPPVSRYGDPSLLLRTKAEPTIPTIAGPKPMEEKTMVRMPRTLARDPGGSCG